MAMIAAVPAVEAAAAPVAEAAAGRAAGGAAAKRAGGQAAKKAPARTPKPAAAGPAGGPPPPPGKPAQPPTAPAMANDLMDMKAPAQKAGRSVTDAFKSATLKPPNRLNAKDASGFLFGLVLYALALSAIKYGADGPKGWLSAKFLNKVTLSGVPR